MPTFSRAFGLRKTQPELDFVDVSLHRDNPVFVDPFAIAQERDRWSQDAATTVGVFFQQVVDDIRGGQEDRARQLLLNLREPNETRLGFSRGRPKGAGIGQGQAEELFAALRDSGAVRTGFITALEESELMIDGISHDKISDLTTNVIRGHLVAYTQQQCELHGIAVQSEIAARWTFRLDRFTGHVAQLVKTKDEDTAWEDMEVLRLPHVACPTRARFQVFTSGLAARHTFLIDTDTGRTWLIVSANRKHADGTEYEVSVWQPFSE